MEVRGKRKEEIGKRKEERGQRAEGRGDRREKIVRVKEILELKHYAGIKDNLTPQINRFHISPRWNEGKSRFHPSTIYRTYGVNWTSMAGRAHPSTTNLTWKIVHTGQH